MEEDKQTTSKQFIPIMIALVILTAVSINLFINGYIIPIIEEGFKWDTREPGQVFLAIAVINMAISALLTFTKKNKAELKERIYVLLVSGPCFVISSSLLISAIFIIIKLSK